MTELEREVLQAAFDLVEANYALDLGCPAQGLVKRAMNDLEKACTEIASNNDGKLVISNE